MKVKFLVAVALAAAVPAAASAAELTVQMYGAQKSLPATPVPTTGPLVVKKAGTPGCAGTSAAGALERATAGAWEASYFDGFGYSVDAILEEAHAFSSGTYWAFYVNGLYQNTGLCDTRIQEGDDLLFYPRCAGSSSRCFEEEPLAMKAPAIVRPGTPFDVLVRETTTTFDPNFAGTSTTAPSPGAAVSGGGAPATSTDTQGRAALTLSTRGTTVLTARKGTRPVVTARTCVTDGADGFCGTTAPAPSQQPAPSGGGSEPAPSGSSSDASTTPAVTPAPCLSNGRDGRCGSIDTTAPSGLISSIAEGRRFARGHGPRTLRGSVDGDPSGLRTIQLRLTRTYRGRCTTFDGARERFVAMARCGAARGKRFGVGDRQAWSYLLPSALPRGRYVLDVITTDGVGNVDATLQRGRNRIMFVVA